MHVNQLNRDFIYINFYFCVFSLYILYILYKIYNLKYLLKSTIKYKITTKNSQQKILK